VGSAELLDDIREDLAALDFVLWDRFAAAPDHVVFYGWIPRQDGRADFVLLRAYHHGTEYTTSSARWSDRIGDILAGVDPAYRDSHGQCLRVEDHFPDLPNVCHRRCPAADGS
jgi:hypothetical protein